MWFRKSKKTPASTENQAEGDLDKIIREEFFASEDAGVFVDIGAARPDYLSMSALYRSLGWNVIGIEPNPKFCELHAEKGIHILQYACGEHDEDDVDFQVVNSHGSNYGNGKVSYESFSSLALKDSYAAIAKDLDVTTIKVKLRRLDTILAEHAPEVERIDILSADVEGWELEVINGLDVDRYKPRVMVIENLFDEKKYYEHMDKLGYDLWRVVAPNDVYVRRDD